MGEGLRIKTRLPLVVLKTFPKLRSKVKYYAFQKTMHLHEFLDYILIAC